MTTIAQIRSRLPHPSMRCSPTCPGWGVFDLGITGNSHLEIQICDECCGGLRHAPTDEEVSRLPEAQRAIRKARTLVRRERRVPSPLDRLERAIKDAECHGQDSDPDHEVGDLIELVRRLGRAMPAELLTQALADWEPWDA